MDINIIPLVINPFTEAKSDLKYYEAALVEVPSVASPTAVYQSAIEHGSNGFLARTSDDWYEALRNLIVNVDCAGEWDVVPASTRSTTTLLRSLPAMPWPSTAASCRIEGGGWVSRATNRPSRSLWQTWNEPSGTGYRHCRSATRRVEAGLPVTLQLPASTSGFTAVEAWSAIAGRLGYEPRHGVQLGDEIACCDILVATDSTTAFQASISRHRARWAAYLVSEYEPAHRTTAEHRDKAARSYHLGLDLLALDPLIARCLSQAGDLSVKLLPAWVETLPRELDGCHQPNSVLVIGTSSVPGHAWDQAILALEWIGWDHPDLRFLTCGHPHTPPEVNNPRWQYVTSMTSPEYQEAMRDRPICVVLYPSGRPQWVHDLLARGCTVIAVAACLDWPTTDAELKEGVIQVAADGRTIAQSIDSLLIDPVRLGALTLRGRALVESLSRPIDTAHALLHEFHAACAPDVKLHHGEHVKGIDDPHFGVA